MKYFTIVKHNIYSLPDNHKIEVFYQCIMSMKEIFSQIKLQKFQFGFIKLIDNNRVQFNSILVSAAIS